jgi:DNA-binding SARP family transcriptional activator
MDASSAMAGLSEGRMCQPPPLDVSVLGRVDVRVDGRPLRVGRTKSMELLVYLALHDGGVDTDRLWEALWPGRAMSAAVLHTTVSVARRSLRERTDGPPLVSDARGGRVYELNARTRLDWDEFERLVGQWCAPPTVAVSSLARALDLVRGPPFTSAAPGSYDWARGHRADMEEAIGSVAARLGEALLERGDAIGARRAARGGLRGAPYDERLYRVLMRAAHLADHAAGVESVMHELTDVLGVDLDGTEGCTQDLYRDLRRGPSV